MSKTRQIAYLLIANLQNFTKPKTLPTFNIQHPVDSTSIKSVATIRQLPYTNYNYSLTTPTITLTYLKQYKNDINPDT